MYGPKICFLLRKWKCDQVDFGNFRMVFANSKCLKYVIVITLNRKVAYRLCCDLSGYLKKNNGCKTCKRNVSEKQFYKTSVLKWISLNQSCTTQKTRISKFININLAPTAKVCSILFRCNLEEILERQLSAEQAFATFSPIEKALSGQKNSSERPHMARGPYVVQACSQPDRMAKFVAWTLTSHKFITRKSLIN